MKKRILSVLLCLTLALTLVGPIGCNDNRPTYTLTFETYGGTAIASRKLRAGEKISKPSKPTKTYYNFDGWYADEDFADAFVFGSMPANDVTAYAKWVPYLISRLTFETDGGTAVEPVTGTAGESFGVQTSKNGYTFGGWYTDKNLTQALTSNVFPATDATLYAKWILAANCAEVTFSAGGRTAVVAVEKGSAVTAPELFDDGYTVDGWYTDAALSDKANLSSIQASVTLYAAVWSNGQEIKETVLDSYAGKSTDVIIKSGVTEIGLGAFAGNLSLGTVVVPDGVTVIRSGAFSGCKYLTEVTLPNTVETIEDGAFLSCVRLSSVNLPTALTEIGEGAFAGCESLTGIVFPDGLEVIGENAFTDCSSLDSLELPDSLVSIGKAAFCNLPLIERVNIPKTVELIGEGAFAGCGSLTAIDVDPQNSAYVSENGNVYNKAKTSLLYYFGSGKEETSFTLPATVTDIAVGAFEYGKNLTSLTIPDRVTALKKGVLSGLDSLEELTVPAFTGEYSYFAYLFGAPSPLSNGVDGAFIPSTLEKVTVSGELSEVPAFAFYGCKTLKEIVLSYADGLDTFGDSAFAYTGITSFEVPASVVSLGNSAFVGTYSLLGFTVEDGNTAFAAEGGCIYNAAATELVKVPCGAEEITSIPASVRTVKAGAFEQAIVTKVVIPNTVETIEQGAFDRCLYLKELSVPFVGRCLPADPVQEDYDTYNFLPYIFGAGMTTRSDGTAIPDSRGVLPDSLSKVTVTGEITEIPAYGFYYCHIAEIVIPDTVVKVCDHAFHVNDSLEEIIIPASVKEIGTYAYAETSATKITVPGTLESMGTFAFAFSQGLEEIVVEEGVTAISDGAFMAINYVFLGSVEGNLYTEYWGSNISKLTKVTLPASLETVGRYAFLGAGMNGTGYKRVNGEVVASTEYSSTGVVFEIPMDGNLKTVGQQAFMFSGISALSLPAATETVSDDAFHACPFLKSMSFGDAERGSNLSSLGDQAFYMCPDFEDLYIYKTIETADEAPSIGKSCFVALRKIYVPAQSLEAYKEAWTGLSEYIDSL